MCTKFQTTKYLCMSSAFIGLSSVLLFYMGKYVISFLSFILCLTSINHWRDYQHGGWRQRMDLFMVLVCGLYILIEIFFYGSEFQKVLLVTMFFCILVFFRISMTECKAWAIFHMNIHLYASIFIPLVYLL
jgi:hypothetical protein